MLNKKVEEAINAQINAELWSAYLYLSMAAWCHANGNPGMGKWFEVQFQEEQDHAKIFFKYLEGGKVTVSPSIDAGVIGDTATNLRISANEEMVEGVQMYTDAAKVADEEGFPEIASHFRAIAEIENRHHARFEAYIKQIETGTVWKREVPIKWQCLVCGYVYEGLEPPKVCPACDHPYQHYIALDMDEL